MPPVYEVSVTVETVYIVKQLANSREQAKEVVGVWFMNNPVSHVSADTPCSVSSVEVTEVAEAIEYTPLAREFCAALSVEMAKRDWNSVDRSDLEYCPDADGRPVTETLYGMVQQAFNKTHIKQVKEE